MSIKKFLWLPVVVLAIALSSCGSDDAPSLGISSQNWDVSKAQQVYPGKTLTLKFVADEDWIATASASWVQLLVSKGSKGESFLQLVPNSNAGASREAAVTITVGGRKNEVKLFQEPSSAKLDDIQVNLFQDKVLRENYLWNDEYAIMEKDFALEYDAYLQKQLLAMTTNTLDKRKNASSGDYHLFSYIEKKPSYKSKAVLINKERSLSMGITGCLIVFYKDSKVALWVLGVYPDSPASKAGIKRGTILTSVDGVTITEDNYVNHFYNILYPANQGTHTLTDASGASYTVESSLIYLNPVIHSEVKEIGGHKIGYLVYNSFDASFDDELFAVFQDFKTKGVTDMVVDLRYNGGGHTISASLIASCIAGEASRDKTFMKYRFNDTRMKSIKPEELLVKFPFNKYDNLNTSLGSGALNLNKVYFLVSSMSASSSELVINSLRGIDVETVLIGTQTVGKNVGMEVEEKTINGSTYIFAPITFQSYNAKDYGDYQDGFVPDYPLDEFDAVSSAGGSGYVEFGSLQEPMFRKAVELITGMSSFPSDAKTKSAQRYVVNRGEVMTDALYNPMKNNMVVLRDGE